MTSVPVDEPTVTSAISLPKPPSRTARLRERIVQSLPDIVLPTITFLIVLLIWHIVANHIATGFPGIGETWARGVELLSNPYLQPRPQRHGPVLAGSLLTWPRHGRLRPGGGRRRAGRFPDGFQRHV